MKTNSLDKIGEILSKTSDTVTENSVTAKHKLILAQLKTKEKEAHKKALKEAKREYKASMEKGETWEDLFNQTDKPTSQPVKQKRKRITRTKEDTKIAIERAIERAHKRFREIERRENAYKQNVLNKSKLSKDSGNSLYAEYTPEFILDWNFVEFFNKYIVVHSYHPQIKHYIPFRDTRFEYEESRKSFQFLKRHFKTHLPEVKCYISKSTGLIMVDTIKFKSVLEMLNAFSGDDGTEYDASDIHKLSYKFESAVNRGSKMTDVEFKKYKSEFINYLIEEKSSSRKIIPCQECLRYEMSKETYDIEDAFMFVLPNYDGSSTIVYENLNIDRSTLLFKAEKDKEMDAARQIFTFMNGMDLNKRSSLRNKWIKMKGHGIIRYKSINHTELWEWKNNLSQFRNGWSSY